MTEQESGHSTLIHHNLDGDPFARIPKTLLDDQYLSWKAKGILSYLLGKPNHWKLQMTDLVNKSRDGADSVKAGIRELRESGYVKLVCLRRSGQIASWNWYVSDKPIYDLPEVENPQVAIPQVHNPPLSKNDGSKNEFNRSSSISSNDDTEDSLSSSRESLTLVAEQGTLVNEKCGLPPDCQEIIEAWRRLPCLPRILTTAGKLKPIRAALRDPFFRANWRDALSRIPKIPFLMGAKGFKANFNWFINPENVEKIINNSFDGKETPKPKNWDRDKI